MATLSASHPGLVSQSEAVAERAAGIPWYIWCAVIAGTSVMIGGHWDISWHESIGRDTFWTPAHVAIYACGVLAGIAFGYLILHTTFSKSSPLAAASVHIWGLRAPLGAFIAAWGGIAMLTSAPFDNWWHNAYGLDVKIVSPPHILLFIGIYGVKLGTLVLIAAFMNRQAESRKGGYRALFLYICSMLLVMTMVVLMEYVERPLLHTAMPYILVSTLTIMLFAIAAFATDVPFAATCVAGFYTLFRIGLILVLPLFPAEPKLGPVYQHVTQFIPPAFPLLLIVPAFLLDLFWQRSRNWNVWAKAVVSAAIFVGSLVAVEWPFANFLMSPAARNWFFGTKYLYYGMPPTSYAALNEFYPSAGITQFCIGLLIAVVLSTVTVRWGMARAQWFKAVKR